jgi:hypothetical protein
MSAPPITTPRYARLERLSHSQVLSYLFNPPSLISSLIGLQCMRLSGKSGDKYSFSTWKGTGVAYTNDIRQGKFTTLPYGPV